MDMLSHYSDRIVCDLKTVKSKIVGLMENEWKIEVNSKPKLRTFRLFKKEFKTSDSVFINNRLKRSL